MDGVTVTRVVRPVRLVRFADINQRGRAAPTVQQPPNPDPRKNNRCLKTFLLLILYFIGISSIALGAVRLNDCPAQKMLPTGLIIFGGMLMVSRLLNCVHDFRRVCEEEFSEDTPQFLFWLNLLFCVAEFGMFIALCCYAFSVDPTTKPEDYGLKNYCDYGLYKASFYGCTILLIIFGLTFISCCCLIVCTLLGMSTYNNRPLRPGERPNLI